MGIFLGLVFIILIGSISSSGCIWRRGGKQYVFKTKWGALGTASGQFKDAGWIGLDALGHIYVVDRSNDRIEKFDSNGTFITTWDSLGTSNGQFNEVTDLTVDSAGYVYVSDYGKNNVQVFGPSTNPHPIN